MDIPKHLWIYHDKELIDCDEFTKANINSWRTLNTHSTIIILTPSNLHLYIDYINLNDPTSIGFNVLYNFGGIFTTSSVRCHKQMDNINLRKNVWLFGLFDNENAMPCLPWFIVSIPENDIIKQWLDYCVNSGNQNTNEVIYELIHENLQFKTLWDEHVKLENGKKCYARNREIYNNNIDSVKSSYVMFIDAMQ